MLVDSDGLPKLGKRAKCLGVREPPGPNADVDIDSSGNVVIIQQDAQKVTPARQGLSVADDWRSLPGYLIPIELGSDHKGASGKGIKIFVHGSGPFEEGYVTDCLVLWHKPGTSKNGVVAPSAEITLSQFQNDLAATRQNWFVDEGKKQ